MAGSRGKISNSVFALFFIAASLLAQNAEELGDQALNTKIVELVKENEFLQARPYLLEIQKRMVADENTENMEAVDFFLGSAHLQEYQESKNEEALQKAVKTFEAYVEKYPSGPRKIIALLNLGDAYSDLKDYEKAIRTYATIYNSPRTSGSVRNDIRRVISKTFIKTDEPERGMRYFFEAYEQAVLNQEAKAEAATWIMQAYLSKGEIDKILPYFKDLTGRKAALFNPKFNVMLIKAGDNLFESGNYDFAILFYEIVKKKNDIVAFYEEEVGRLRQGLEYKEEGSEEAISTEKRLREAEANLKAVKGMRDYDADVRWRSARVLLESERTWEALWSFYNLMLDYPKHEQAEEFLFLAFSQARKLNDFFMVVKLADDYLARKDYKQYRGQITLDLATYYQNQGYHDKFYDLATDYLNAGAEQDKVGKQLANLLAIHLMDRGKYTELYQQMDRYNRVSQGKRGTQESSKYWTSLALIIQADYTRALKSFNEFLDAYGSRSMFSEDAYYRRAICLYGEGRAQEAYEEFTTFVKDYPTSKRRGEAELYLGDIKREEGQLERALEHYQLVDEFSDQLMFITKAIFAIAEVLEVERRDEEAAQTLLDYIQKYGDDAELGEAYLKLGNFEQRQGRIHQRFEYNKRGLIATANDPTRYSADKILLEYVRDYPEFVKNYQAAIRLIDAMLSDTNYLEKIMKDRSFQYEYFESEEGQAVDPGLIENIVRNRAFRRNLLEAPATVLNDLRSNYSAKLNRLAPYKPGLVFSDLMARVSGASSVLVLRILMAREKDTLNILLRHPKDEGVASYPGGSRGLQTNTPGIETIGGKAENGLLEVRYEAPAFDESTGRVDRYRLAQKFQGAAVTTQNQNVVQSE